MRVLRYAVISVGRIRSDCVDSGAARSPVLYHTGGRRLLFFQNRVNRLIVLAENIVVIPVWAYKPFLTCSQASDRLY